MTQSKKDAASKGIPKPSTPKTTRGIPKPSTTGIKTPAGTKNPRNRNAAPSAGKGILTSADKQGPAGMGGAGGAGLLGASGEPVAVSSAGIKVARDAVKAKNPALALSGGGAKGSFQMGALRYLYDRVFSGDEPIPAILAGTSVGSVNAVKLAEGGRAAFDELERLWLGLQKNDDMYLQQDWFKNLTEMQQKLMRIVGNGLDAGDFAGPFLRVIFPGLEIDGFADFSLEEIERAFTRAGDAKGMFHLGPIGALMDKPGVLDAAKIKKANSKLRLAVINLSGGQLRYVTETGTIVERDNQTPVNWGGAVGKGDWGDYATVPQECKGIRESVRQAIKALKAADQTPADKPSDKPSKGGAPSTKNKELDDAIAAALIPLQDCLKKHPTVRLQDGVLASAAIPVVFEPIWLLNSLYVDGGVREVVPIQVTIDLGADKVYAILAGTVKSAPPDYIRNIPDIAQRALNIALDEVILNETEASPKWQGQPVILIAPNLEVHDMLTIEPGLIRIAMAYGYMCAADTLEIGNEEDRREAGKLADKMTRYRKNSFHSQKAGVDGIQKIIKSGKTPTVSPSSGVGDGNNVRALVRERLGKGFSIPPNIERAWMSWECHQLAQFQPVVWPSSPPPSAAALAACDDLKRAVTDCKGRLFAAKETNPNDPPAPSKGGQPNLKNPEIRALERELAAAEKLYADCLKKHTKRQPWTHGLLVRSKQSAAEVFVIYGGSKLLLRGANPMAEMQYDPVDILPVPAKALERLPLDKPADGTILGNVLGEVFIMEKGKKKQLIPPPSIPKWYEHAKYDPNFTSSKQEAREIRLVPVETLKAIK